MTYYETSTGERVSQQTIERRRSAAYKEYYGADRSRSTCEETGLPSEGSSHIISQKRCKQLRKTELIWNPENFFPALNSVNSRWENNDSTLKNYWKYMEVVKKYDPEGYNKRLYL